MEKQLSLLRNYEHTSLWNAIKETWSLAAGSVTNRTRLGRLCREFEAEGADGELVKWYAGIYLACKPWCGQGYAFTPDAVLKYWGALAAKAEELDGKTDRQIATKTEDERRFKAREAELIASGWVYKNGMLGPP